MTTFHYHDGVFYADTRAYVNGQPFNISQKVVPLAEPFEAKAVLFHKAALPVTIDDTILGYFIGHAVQPGRALFAAIETAARHNPSDVQMVLQNHARFVETFKLASTEAHFSLHLIGIKGLYIVTMPWNIEQEVTYDYTPYVSEQYPKGARYSLGANHEILAAYTSAGLPTVVAYYMLFLTQPESGGNIETWRIRRHADRHHLVRHEVYLEQSMTGMQEVIERWQTVGRAAEPVPDMSSVYSYGPDLMSKWNLETYLSRKGFSMMRDDNEIITHLVPTRGKPIDLRDRSAAPAGKKKS